MKRVLLFIIAFNFINLNAQTTELLESKIIDIAVEVQATPTSLIPGVTFATNLTNKDAISIRFATNFFNHNNLAMKADINNHISEKGFGFGARLGIRHYFMDNIKKLYGGFRVDLTKNKVNWTKDSYTECLDCKTELKKGISEVVTLQPSVMLGWLFELGKKKNIFFTPEIALGYDWNSNVNGEETYFGPNVLLGVSFGYRNLKKKNKINFIDPIL